MNESANQVPILLVDDGPENLLVLSAILRRPDYQLYQASSGKEALDFVRDNEFAIVLLDVHMPELDGYQVASMIKTMRGSSTPPIIFITASGNDFQMVRRGYEVGAVDYLMKPVDPPTLRSKVSVFADLYRAKKEIRRQAELLRIHDENERNSFLENALDAVIGMNQSGQVNYWNQQAEAIFGWSKEETLGKSLSELIIPSNFRAPLAYEIKKFLETGESSLLKKRIEIVGLRRDGKEFPVEISVTPIFSNGRYNFSAFLRDISERKREQINLKKAIQARDEFISVCSHELKTPITSLKLQFQLTARQLQNNDPKSLDQQVICRRVETTNKQLDRMTRLIENMLDVSRISSGPITIHKTQTNINHLVKDIIQNYEEQLLSLSIDLRLTEKHKDILIEGDADRLVQVISNLLTNAIKYGEGSPIDVILEKKDDKALISFSDHGIGIKEEDRERIFNRYERAVSASEISGLGLGLYISQQIIEAHSGKLRVHSKPGKGSTFTVEFPLYQVPLHISH